MKHVFARCLLVLICLAVGLGGLAEGYVWAIPPQYDYVSHFSEGLAAVLMDGKWGFIDQTGKEVVPPQYGEVGGFRDGVARVLVGRPHDGISWVITDTGKWGFIDQTGKEVVPPKYDWAGDFIDGLAMVWIADQDAENYRNTGRWGFIDKAGNEVVPVIYDTVGPFREGRASVIKDGMLGFVDETGAVVIPLTYAYESPSLSSVAFYQNIMPFFSEGLAAIWGGETQNDQYGYIDTDGHVVIPFAYDYAAPFSEGLAYVSKGGGLVHPDSSDGKFGFIDKTGQAAIPLVYDCDYSGCGGIILEQFFMDGLALVSKGIPHEGIQYGMIDKTGAVIVPIQYDWIWPYGDGLALVGFGYDIGGWETWESCGLVDGGGKEVVPVGHYDGIGYFSEGFAQVLHGASRDEYNILQYGSGAYGFIDTTGKEVVPCIFEDVRFFSEGLAAVLVDGKWGYIAISNFAL